MERPAQCAETNATAVFLRFLRGLLLAAFLLYLLACAWLYSAQGQLPYFPARAAAPTSAEPVSFPVEGQVLQAWVLRQDRPCAVLYFGGNGEQVERLDGLFTTIPPECSIYLLAYRGYSGNAGQPGEALLFADAVRQFDQIAARHGRVSVIGRSLGSGVAVQVAALRPVHRLVLVTPYDSIANVAQGHYPMFPVRWLLRDRYESWRRAPAIQARTLVLVAGRDEVIPRANTLELVRHFRVKPEMVEFVQAGHNDVSRQPGYAAAIEAFLMAD